MLMTVGKYKGFEIEVLPSSYLKYVAENFDENKSDLNRMIVAECDDELEFREKFNCHFEDEPF